MEKEMSQDLESRVKSLDTNLAASHVLRLLVDEHAQGTSEDLPRI
jgi:hypothetical protein